MADTLTCMECRKLISPNRVDMQVSRHKESILAHRHWKIVQVLQKTRVNPSDSRVFCFFRSRVGYYPIKWITTPIVINIRKNTTAISIETALFKKLLEFIIRPHTQSRYVIWNDIRRGWGNKYAWLLIYSILFSTDPICFVINYPKKQSLRLYIAIIPGWF